MSVANLYSHAVICARLVLELNTNQLTALLKYLAHHQEVAACAEKHSQDNSASTKTIRCMDITTPTSLQGPHNRDTNVPQSASDAAPDCTDITLVGRSAVHQAFHQNRVREACLPTLCTNCLELATEIDHQLRLTASV